MAGRPVTFLRAIEATLLCYTGRRDLPELVAALRSFFHHVGRPARLVIGTDGTMDAAGLAVLRSLPVAPAIWQPPDFAPPPGAPPVLVDYFQAHPLGKKVCLLMRAQELAPFVFSDSDILFLPGAAELAKRLSDLTAPGWFMQDCAFSLDRRMLDAGAPLAPGVNSGLLAFLRPVPFDDALNRFARLQVPGEFFTEQTIVHLAMTQAGCQPLPPDLYILQNNDQWLWRDLHVKPGTAARHYISSFRHKMWLRVRFNM